LQTVDENLSALHRAGKDEKKIKRIVSRLNNGIDGLVNTASELGLIRYYLDKGQFSDFDVSFHEAEIDVDFDLKVIRDGQEGLIDVVNLQLREWKNVAAWDAAGELIPKLSAKVVEKARKKHIEMIKKHSSTGFAIALDWTKDQEIAAKP